MPKVDDEDTTEEMAEAVRMIIMKPERYRLHMEKRKEREYAGREEKKTESPSKKS